MKALLSLSHVIDKLNERIGLTVSWLVLAAVLISAANAVVRKAFNVSSNSFLEIQWYLFSVVFLFCAGYTLLRNQHVRIDVIAGRLSPRAQAWIDILGTLFFLLPMSLTIMWLSWPVFIEAYQRQEVSTNAGGLIIWPARLLVPIGFFLLVIQGVSELIKRIAFLKGLIPDPAQKQHEKSAEEELAEDILRVPGREGMTAFLIANMAPLMFAALIVVMLLGYPVAFALGAVGIGFGLLGIELGLLQATLFQALPERIWGVMSNDTLLAIPFFTFMGLILERSGMAEDLLETIGQLFGPVRGGLAYAVIFVGALLAATTGVVAASVISMGLISLPIMLRYGYDRRFASGVIAASGTLAQIIPPSLVLIIMADQLGKSVGDMYAGAFIPGITLIGTVRGLHDGCVRREARVGAGAAGGSADAEGAQRRHRHAVVARVVRAGRHRRSRLRQMVLPARRAAGRNHCRGNIRRNRIRLLRRAHRQIAEAQGLLPGSPSASCSC